MQTISPRHIGNSKKKRQYTKAAINTQWCKWEKMALEFSRGAFTSVPKLRKPHSSHTMTRCYYNSEIHEGNSKIADDCTSSKFAYLAKASRREWKRDPVLKLRAALATDAFVLRLNDNDHIDPFQSNGLIGRLFQSKARVSASFLSFFLRVRQVSFEIHNSWPSETIDNQRSALCCALLSTDPKSYKRT